MRITLLYSNVDIVFCWHTFRKKIPSFFVISGFEKSNFPRGNDPRGKKQSQKKMCQVMSVRIFTIYRNGFTFSFQVVSYFLKSHFEAKTSLFEVADIYVRDTNKFLLFQLTHKIVITSKVVNYDPKKHLASQFKSLLHSANVAILWKCLLLSPNSISGVGKYGITIWWQD